MTLEQTEDLFFQLEALHPREGEETLQDPDFERERAAEEEACRDVLWADTVVLPHGAEEKSPQLEPGEEWEEMSDWDCRRLERQREP